MSDHVEPAACFVCRCEEIPAEEIARAIDAGARTINDVKRRTRAGMGRCQGIYCLSEIAAAITAQRGVPPAAVTPMTVRPPMRAIGLGELAALAGPESPEG